MKALPPTQSIWAISDTASGMLTVSKGLLEAASSDNVQPLALLSTEAFGALLPISPETRRKVEVLANRGYTSHVINFVKAKVGYRKNDSVWQLAQSDGGIRFLCFMASLYTMGSSEAALRLDKLLQKTQKDTSPRPTLLHLQDLVDVLEPKLKISDFASTVATAEQWLRTKIAGLPETARTKMSFDVAQIPPEQAFTPFISAMSESTRVGEESDLLLQTRSQYVPWLLAFLEWSLGDRPRTLLPDGKCIQESEGSHVVLHILPNPAKPRSGNKRSYQQVIEENTKGFQVSLYHKVDKLRDVVFESDVDSKQRAWEGLLNIEECISYKLDSLFYNFPEILRNQELFKSAGQALYFIIVDLPDYLLLSENAMYSKIDQHLCAETIKAFPSKHTRIELATRLLNEKLPLHHASRDPKELLRPDNLSKILQACNFCKSLSLKRPPGGRPELKKFGGSLPCQVNDFLEELSELGASILITSLLGRISDLTSFPMMRGGRLVDPNMLHRPAYHHFAKRNILARDSFPHLINTGWQAVMHGRCKFLACSSKAVFNYVRHLIGHTKTDSTLIVSSAGGQVVYPLMFEADSFIPEGYLQMIHAQGQLIYEDMKFSCVECAFTNEMSENRPDDGSADTAIEVDVFDEDAGVDSDTESLQHETGQPIETLAMETGERSSPEDEDSPMHEPQAEAAQLKVEIGSEFSIPGLKPDEKARIEWTLHVMGTRLLARTSFPGESDAVFAWSLIDYLSICVLTGACTHRKTKSAGPLGQHFLLSNSLTEPLDPQGPKHVIFAGRKLSHQQLALVSQDDGWPVVVDSGSCIRCALEKCQSLNLKIVIC